MQSHIFDEFRLVGGTALSLQRGHRMSVDIDLFTDAIYDSVDFGKIEEYLKSIWPYVDSYKITPIGFGKSYFVGKNEKDCIKLDIYYTDPFIEGCKITDTIRLASVSEIIAMKMDVIARGGRKKDFWDIHDLIGDYSLNNMLALHKKRYPYIHDPDLIRMQLTNFSSADEDFEPICLQGKHWELIKLDLIEFSIQA
jgi:predicted nucleotidyltransferase component of viral defense system